MARHSKSRRYQWGYPPQYMPPMLPMPMGGAMFPFPPPPPPPLMAPPMMPYVPPNPAPAKPAPQAASGAAPHTALERACLPHFAAEYGLGSSRDATDIVIMDFDRSLLKTPSLNLDLMDKDSRHVLESRLGTHSGWWQSPVILEAALERGEWDANLLEIARAAAQNPQVLLVITTYRSGELEPRIRSALASQGVPTVDHFACSTHNHYTMGSKAKHQLLDVLLGHYASIERVFVLDASSPDRKAYDQAAFRHVKDGSFRAETFRIVNLVATHTHFAPLRERQLVESLIQTSGAAVKASVVTTNWQHIVADGSRQDLVEYVSATPPFADATQVLCNEIGILAGKLPAELRPHVGEPGNMHKWRLGGYEAHGRTLYLYAVPLGAPPLAEPYTDHGARFEGARLAKQTDNPYTPLQGPEFTTYVYERRALRVHESKA